MNPKNVKCGQPVVQAPLLVLAVDDLRLVGMQPQPDLFHPVPDRGHQIAGLAFGDAMHHHVIGKAASSTPGYSRVIHASNA